MKIWDCKIGGSDVNDVPDGGDMPMRQAVSVAYFQLTGKAPEFIFSGWGGKLTKTEQDIAKRKARR